MKTCPYCAEEIQDAAAVCKHCGRELGAGGATTIQQTSKGLKLQTLAGWSLFWIGLLWAIFDGSSTSAFPWVVALGGFGWVAVTKARTWWHHG